MWSETISNMSRDRDFYAAHKNGVAGMIAAGPGAGRIPLPL